MSTLRVHVRHVQACGFCLVPGARDWLKHHGFEWRDFVQNGIALEDLQAIDDAMCKQVVQKVLEEESKT